MANTKSVVRKQAQGTADVVSDLWALLRDYGKQETIDPLKNLGRFVGYGSAAALCFGIAGTLATVAILRIVQVEGGRWLDGNWSWVAYVLALVAVSFAAYLSLQQIKKGNNS